MMVIFPGNSAFQPEQRGNIAQQNNHYRNRRIMQDGKQVRRQIIQEGQADPHKEQNDVNNPAEKTINKL
ncbi:Uncharacterised protein [Enterobacter cloacae]|nr:Uncharacterised protein [Enterobacter cloacae]